MDLSRVSQGQLIAGAGGLLLFISLFFHWGGGQSAWNAFSFVEIWLLIVAIVAVVYGFAAVVGFELGVPAEAGLIVAGLGMAALGWSFGLETEVSGSIGVWLAIIAALGIVFGAFDATRSPVGAASARRAAAPPPPPPTTPVGTSTAPPPPPARQPGPPPS